MFDEHPQLTCALVSNNEDFTVHQNDIDPSYYTYDCDAGNVRHVPLSFGSEFGDCQLQISMYCCGDCHSQTLSMTLEFIEFEVDEYGDLETHRCETKRLLEQLSLLEWTGVEVDVGFELGQPPKQSTPTPHHM
jgi:hypothetical protein